MRQKLRVFTKYMLESLEMGMNPTYPSMDLISILATQTLTKNFEDFGFSSLRNFKRGTMLTLYYISKISAERIVGEYIVNSERRGKPIKQTDVNKYIWEGESEDCLGKWSVYIDLRQLE